MHPHIRMLLKGISRLDSPRQRKAPVSTGLLESCFHGPDMADPFEQALWGCLSFFFLLRPSEIVAINNDKFRWFAVRAQDIVVDDSTGQPTLSPSQAQTVYMRLIGSKTNQNGVATTRFLSHSGHPFLCPVFGALILPQSRKTLPADIPAAVSMSRNPLPTADVSTRLKHSAKRTDNDPRHFSLHSLRSGGATHMYRSGTDALTIQFHGHWVSDAFKAHTRLFKESVTALASTMMPGRGVIRHYISGANG
ncbi:LOW QUALITY PROTEIN: hypothetical protein PHMEG_00011369 [Phytophthora megakarya]|uniref:Tyr recombinase domain-containing protein n=1 Tax=Phytophthora megakarya TaxID=4795 RepID=A0A225WBG2_9STRA|nr:LOW QUALITY PROTEIN: hypothetical protein PHMEG_00011369 [Phytophthora megakarya]